ncbi:MAG: hypothetical protein FWG63_01330 [Defluviitaleaceae bacterium]|nr:hypothetical protein [Defluviitaleaceae bacterium]
MPLPNSAINGSWALAFLESEHSRNSKSIDELAENSALVLRAEVLDRRIEVFGWGGGDPFFNRRSESQWAQFYVYRLKVLNPYKGTLNNGFTVKTDDVIEIFQYRSLSSRFSGELDWIPITIFDIIPSDILITLQNTPSMLHLN